MFLSLIFCSRSKKISASLRRKVWPRLRLVSFSEILTVLLRSIASLAAKSFASSKLTVCAFSLQFRLQFSVILGNNDKYNVNGYWIVVKYANGKSRDGLALCQFKEDIVVDYNKHKHVYLCTFTEGPMKKAHANGYGMISEERHNRITSNCILH